MKRDEDDVAVVSAPEREEQVPEAGRPAMGLDEVLPDAHGEGVEHVEPERDESDEQENDEADDVRRPVGRPSVLRPGRRGEVAERRRLRLPPVLVPFVSGDGPDFVRPARPEGVALPAGRMPLPGKGPFAGLAPASVPALFEPGGPRRVSEAGVVRRTDEIAGRLRPFRGGGDLVRNREAGVRDAGVPPEPFLDSWRIPEIEVDAQEGAAPVARPHRDERDEHERPVVFRKKFARTGLEGGAGPTGRGGCFGVHIRVLSSMDLRQGAGVWVPQSP